MHLCLNDASESRLFAHRKAVLGRELIDDYVNVFRAVDHDLVCSAFAKVHVKNEDWLLVFLAALHRRLAAEVNDFASVRFFFDRCLGRSLI